MNSGASSMIIGSKHSILDDIENPPTEHWLKIMQRKMRRKGSDVSVIQDIVKKKQITFLKSSNLFT
jgi:hypothetical protein